VCRRVRIGFRVRGALAEIRTGVVGLGGAHEVWITSYVHRLRNGPAGRSRLARANSWSLTGRHHPRTLREPSAQ
jgi:hypothetical protein